MELLDLLIEVERYISRKGLNYNDSIESLTDAMTEDSQED